MTEEMLVKLNVDFSQLFSNSKQAINALNDIGDTINEQKQITIELEKEQQRLRQALEETPKSSIAGQKKLRDELKHVEDALKDQRLALKELGVEKSIVGQAARTLEGQERQMRKGLALTREEITGLNTFTGGYAGKLNQLTRGFNVAKVGVMNFVSSLSTMQKAMLATGIGALVVAVGVLAANWDKVKHAITGIETKLRASLDVQRKTTEQADKRYSRETSIDNILKMQGKSELEIIKHKQQQGIVTLQAKKAELSIMQEIAKKEQESSMRFLQRIQNVTKYMGVLGVQIEAFAIEKLTEKTEDWSDAIEKASDEITKLQNDLAGYELQIRQIANEKQKLKLEIEDITDALWNAVPPADALAEKLEQIPRFSELEIMTEEELAEFNSVLTQASANVQKMKERMSEELMALTTQWQMFAHAVGDIAGSAFDVLFDKEKGFEDFTKAVGDMLKDMIKRMIQAAVAATILSAALAAITGGASPGFAALFRQNMGMGGGGGINRGFFNIGGIISGDDISLVSGRAMTGTNRAGITGR